MLEELHRMTYKMHFQLTRTISIAETVKVSIVTRPIYYFISILATISSIHESDERG